MGTGCIFSARQGLHVAVTSVSPLVAPAARTRLAMTLPVLLATHVAAVRAQLQGTSAAPTHWATNTPWMQAQRVQLMSIRVFSAGTAMVILSCAVKARHAVETFALRRVARVAKTLLATTLFAQRITHAVGTPVPLPMANAAQTVRATSML